MSAALKEILAVVAPRLRAHGYKGSGQNFRLANEDAVSVVNFQKSSNGQRFYVNIGVQPLFVPKESDGDADPKTIKEYQCIFPRRLDPPERELFGWPYSIDLAELLASRFDDLFAAYVQPLMTFPGPVTEASVADFEAQPIHPLLGTRHARNFLHFARISLALGNRNRAADFAKAGIELCGERASSLLRLLQEVERMAVP
jgi:hypothetical protein